MKREDRWVPVTESGHRWVGRPKAMAEQDMLDTPVGGCWSTGEPWDGITHIEHEARYVTEWVVIQPGDLPDDSEGKNLEESA